MRQMKRSTAERFPAQLTNTLSHFDGPSSTFGIKGEIHAPVSRGWAQQPEENDAIEALTGVQKGRRNSCCSGGS